MGGEGNRKARFEIECGGRRRTFTADSPQDAWRKFREAGGVLGDLARFRELPWNSKYQWDNKEGGQSKRGQWRYCHPCWFNTPPAAAFGLG